MPLSTPALFCIIVLSRVQAFLPQIAEANAKLEERLQAGQGAGT